VYAVSVDPLPEHLCVCMHVDSCMVRMYIHTYTRMIVSAVQSVLLCVTVKVPVNMRAYACQVHGAPFFMLRVYASSACVQKA
jgi:hypothetical protein